jgi:asparagine synthase (glutamine-hydrolysing)
MCGFVTIVTPRGSPVLPEVLEDMTHSLAHRGPDDHGYAWVSHDGKISQSQAIFQQAELSGVLFGHRRLSILDLSSAAHQPFVNANGSMVLAYNGEVYNYLEIRGELIARGYSFRSDSDTEVVLTAYECWGTNAFQKFNGMWALALWDANRQTLIVSRDRFGIKPLYQATVGKTWVFASEMKALLRFPGVGREIDDRSVFAYLIDGLVNHTTNTFFSGIQSFPPGTVTELHEGVARQTKYWALETSREQRDGLDAIEQYGELLQDSVRLRTRSDVPIGTMLSGGLDSTSITALIVRQQQLGGMTKEESRGLSSFHNTFTACWPKDPALDEEGAVDLLCSRFGLRSHKLYPSADSIWELLPRVMSFLEEPFESPVPMVQYLLMQNARERGVKVVLNGHGADEALAGYPHYQQPFLIGLLLQGKILRYRQEHKAFSQRGHARLMRGLIRNLIPTVIRSTLVRKLKLDQSQVRRYSLCDPPKDLWDGYGDNVERIRELSTLGNALWQSFHSSIVPRWLRMEDRISMAHGVESRLPFMDHRLVEFTFGLADSMKLNNGYTKFILREAMKEILPDRVVWNRQKRRFTAPYFQWFRGPWRPMLEQIFLEGNCHIEAYLDMAKFRAQLAAYLAGDNQALNQQVLWRILQVEIWMDSIKKQIKY